MLKRYAATASVLVALAATSPASAVVPVVFGTSWDGPSQTLQVILDNRYGVGHVHVETDYIGAHPGDIDPWFWVGDPLHPSSAYLVKEVAGNANRNTLCWYEENGTKPVFPGNGVVFAGPAGAGAMTMIVFDRPMEKFGFLLLPNAGLGVTNAPPGELFLTNRFHNDIGPNGSGALHPPSDGDVQALVFDVSPWAGPNTWAVCFEDCDSGAMPGPP